MRYECWCSPLCQEPEDADWRQIMFKYADRWRHLARVIECLLGSDGKARPDDL